MPGPDWLVPGGELWLAGAPGGALRRRTFVAKDVLDVAGYPTGAGNPSRRADAPAAASSAAAVLLLLAAGADLVGKARTDELAYSLLGLNAVDGSPANPRRPGHVTGGSSSGSAAAVAGGHADIGLGTDTGGSIRVPAAYCGLVGVRPTHGRVPINGMVPLAPSFDTIGWLTADVSLAAAVAAVLLSPPAPAAAPAGELARVVVAEDLVALADPTIRASVRDAASALAAAFGTTVVATELGTATDLDRWRGAFRVLQGAEAWAVHGAWIEATGPALSPPVAQRFAAARRITPGEVRAAAEVRGHVRRRVAEVVPTDAVLVLPAVASGPPPVGIDDSGADQVRGELLRLTCIAPLLGGPSVALPDGVALLAAPGSDEALLRVAALLPGS